MSVPSGLRSLLDWAQPPRNARWALWAMVLLGLVLRLYEVHAYTVGRPHDASRLLGDEPGYNGLALDLIHGRGVFEWPGRVPLYPLFLALLHLLTGESYNAINYLQAVVGLAAIPLTWCLARRVFPDSTVPALVAAFLAATSYALIEHAPRLHSEVLYVPLVLAAMIALWDAFAAPTRGRFALAGAALGVATLVRPTLLFFPAALLVALLLWTERRVALRSWAVASLAMALVLLPWVLFTTIKFRALIPLQTSNAILWQGSPEYYHLLHTPGYSYQRIWSQVIYGPGWQAHDPTSIEGDKWWTHRALNSIAEEPGTYLRYAVEKLGTFWVGDPNADWANSQVFNLAAMRPHFSTRELVMIVTSRGLPILALIACLLLYRERRRLLALYAVLVYVTLLHAATHAEFRLSSPFQPILMVLIGGAVALVLEGRRPKPVPQAP